MEVPRFAFSPELKTKVAKIRRRSGHPRISPKSFAFLAREGPKVRTPMNFAQEFRVSRASSATDTQTDPVRQSRQASAPPDSVTQPECLGINYLSNRLAIILGNRSRISINHGCPEKIPEKISRKNHHHRKHHPENIRPGSFAQLESLPARFRRVQRGAGN